MPLEIPGWQDVVVLQDPRTLPPEIQLARRRELAARIRQSPTPEVARNVGAFVTFLDDIEDLISASIILAVPVLKLVPRAHPAIRAAATVARAFDAARVISPIRAFGRSVGCGPSRALLDDPFESRLYVDRDAGIAELSRRIGPALELGQALETVFGVGLVLGPIVGGLSDLAFSTPLGVPLEYAYRAIEPLTSKALDVLRASPLGWIEGQVFTPEEHLQMALGGMLAWQIAEPWVTTSPVARTLTALADRPISLGRPHNAATIALRIELGEPPVAPAPWPLPGLPEQITPIQASQHLLPRARAVQREIYDAWGHTDQGALFFGAERQIVRSALLSTSGGRPILRENISRQARAWELARVSPELDPTTLSDSQWESLTRRIRATQEATGRTIPPQGDLSEILRATPYTT